MNRLTFLVGLILFIGIIALNTFIIQTVWNKILINKLPLMNIQPLSYIDAFAILIFVSSFGVGTMFIVNQSGKDMSHPMSCGNNNGYSYEMN